MKIIDTSPITITAAMPLKKGTLDLIQSAYTEILNSLIISLIGENYYGSSTVYILYGCDLYPDGENYAINPGVVFRNGEYFNVPAQTGLTSTTLYWDAVQTSYLTATDADPVLFSDNNTHSVHQIRTYQLTTASTTGFLFSDSVRLKSLQTKLVPTNSHYLESFTKGSWQDYDISDFVPSTATFILVRVVFASTTDLESHIQLSNHTDSVGGGTGSVSTMSFPVVLQPIFADLWVRTDGLGKLSYNIPSTVYLDSLIIAGWI